MNVPSAELSPVEDRTLRAQISRKIIDMVTGGHFQPGQRLTENTLASQLRVSRAPLREAVRELVDKGILVSQPYKGLHVRKVGRKDLEELYSMRTALEKLAFTLAWPRRTAAMFEDLDNRYESLISVQHSGDQARAIELEIGFHSWVYENADHSLLLRHWERLAALVQIYLSVHHVLHGAHGKFREMTTAYRNLAKGDDLAAMLDHVDQHMKQGLGTVMLSLPTST